MVSSSVSRVRAGTVEVKVWLMSSSKQKTALERGQIPAENVNVIIAHGTHADHADPFALRCRPGGVQRNGRHARGARSETTRTGREAAGPKRHAPNPKPHAPD